MIPQSILDYLKAHDVPYERRLHRRAFTAQQLAAATHVPGRRVAKAVIARGGGKTFIAVLPATEEVDEERLADLLNVPAVWLLRETEFEHLFPDCEPGAEPPFGGLYGLPVVIEDGLGGAERILFRAGSHEEAIEMTLDDFLRLETDAIAGAFGRVPDDAPRLWEDWPQPRVP